MTISYFSPLSKRAVLSKTREFFHSDSKDKSFISEDILVNVYKNAVEILSIKENESNYKYIEQYLNYVFNNCIIGVTFFKEVENKKFSLQNIEAYYL